MSTFIADPDIAMPIAVQIRHWALNRAAIDCYALRNAAESYGDFERSVDYHDLGDLYLERCFALTAEWAAE